MNQLLERIRSTRPRSRLIAAAGLLAVIIAAALWLVTPKAVRGPVAVVTVPLEVGQTTWIGLEKIVTQPVTVRAVEAVTDADAEILLCDRADGQHVIGSVRDEDLTDYCARTTPVVAGTQLEPNPAGVDPATYVVVGLTATDTTPQVYCGLDLRYRDGLRLGRASPAGASQAVLNPTHDDSWLHIAENCPGAAD